MRHEITRLNRLKEVQKNLKKYKNPNYEKLIAQMCMAWGIMRRTAMEYIKTVNNAGGLGILDKLNK